MASLQADDGMECPILRRGARAGRYRRMIDSQEQQILARIMSHKMMLSKESFAEAGVMSSLNRERYCNAWVIDEDDQEYIRKDLLKRRIWSIPGGAFCSSLDIQTSGPPLYICRKIKTSGS